jgi:HNH endonuclease
MPVSRRARQGLRQRYNFCCGYCGVSEREVGAELTVDHFRPERHGGTDEVANLVYACHACNEFKSDFWSTDPAHQLLHPGQDLLTEHLREEADGTLHALTDRGAFHLAKLHLNRQPLIDRRHWERRQQASQAQAEALARRLQDAESRIAHMERLFGITHAPDQS